METIQRTQIIVPDRLRKDYGDIGDFADSIETYGLIQPIVLHPNGDGSFNLVAGGRRLAACDELNYTTFTHSLSSVPGSVGFVYTSDLPEDVRREIELEENVRRKDMTWQERVLAIDEIHTLKARKAALNSNKWGMKETGDLLGQNYSYISYALTVAAELKNPTSPLHNATGLRDALDMLMQRREDDAKQRIVEFAAKNVAPAGVPTPTPVMDAATPSDPNAENLVVPLSRMLFNGRCEELMQQLPPECVDHIISDWPYAIDMDYLQQAAGMKNIDRVEDTHNVEDNMMMYPTWLAGMHRVLRSGGFCVLWYDNVQWNFIQSHAEAVGFRVQRWPLVWVKTHACLNQSAHKNFTKRTEFAIVLSKGNATIPKPVDKNYWIGGREANTSNPFAKPSGLWTWLYESLCLRGQIVLDPFMGEGSATCAAIRFGLRPLGFESDPNHYNQAVLNVQQTYAELTKGKVNYE